MQHDVGRVSGVCGDWMDNRRPQPLAILPINTQPRND